MSDAPAPPSSPPALLPMLAGIVAGGALLAVAELTGLVLGSSATPLAVVGSVVVDIVPAGLKDLVISLFGTADKLVLMLCMGIVLTLLCAGIGALGARRPGAAALALAVLGLIPTAAALTRASATAADAAPSLVGTLAGVIVLSALLSSVIPDPAGPAPVGPALADPGTGEGRVRETARGRRSLLVLGAAGALALVVGGGSRLVAGARSTAQKAVEAFRVPTPDRSAPAVPADAQVTIVGMPDVITANDDFYRIDTALVVPRVDTEDWSLHIDGLVEQELELSFAELLEESMIETRVTLTCVSNTVGGDLAGNATWIGVPVRTLLARAGVAADADMVLSRSVDGFTASTPLEALTDDRDAILAVAMNGEALPREHGYPVRMVVPGLYGYVSATKWVERLTVTRFADDTAYWTDRGWSERGPIKTASRIDVPRSGGSLERGADGAAILGGTAWAQGRGIAAVEVSIDDGDWQQAELAAALSEDTWVQWSLRWDDAAPGDHTATVRAIDGEGEAQTEEVAPPAPDGASGWHSIGFTVV
ncbi:molybdopterin-dependent oxidoreductase [Brachybacterium sp. DNPG3]